jgi:hypothetical protein
MRSCIAKKIWAWGSPYIQVIGWLVLMSSVLYKGTSLADAASKFDERITKLESSYTESDKNFSNLETKLDTVIDLLKGNRRNK